jgi:hypothetical protein
MLLHLSASNFERVLIGDHHRRLVPEALPEDIVDRAEHSRADQDILRIRCVTQRRGDAFVVHGPSPVKNAPRVL